MTNQKEPDASKLQGPSETAGSKVVDIGPEEAKRVTELAIIWRNFRSNRGAVFGAIIVLLLVLTGVFADFLAPFDPLEQGRDFLQPPSGKHLMGTDTLGRDLLSRVIYGARISLGVGLGAVSVSLLLGLIVGGSGGYFGGRVDALVVMVIDTFMSFPGLLLALVIAAMMGPTLPNVMLAIGIGEFTIFARVIRSAVYVEKEKDYILAAKSIGTSDPLIIGLHIFPNIMAPVIVLTTLNVGMAILYAASLGFLGLGAQPPTPEWGNMVNIGRQYLQIAPWLIWYPGIAIMLTVLGANLMGDGLRDALDPRLRR